MPSSRLVPQLHFTTDQLVQLKQIAPEVFADGKINWEILREALGEYLEPEEASAEHFGLFWPGKREARRLAALPSRGTLLPAPGEGVNEDQTKNLFIQGDNLEVLKLLQKAYAGRVKMIYIDPPYNTGNDFVYNDDFTDPLGEYLRKTGKADEQGLLTTNTRADGRFHSNWLSMMYPRLRLARTMLRDDGVMFVSIDDNEGFHLRSLLNELFGEENFVGQIVVQVNPRGRHLDRFIAKTHEYVLVYAKDITEQALYQLDKDDRMTKEYRKQDQRGQYRELELRNRNPAFNRQTRPNLYYPIFVDPSTGAVSIHKDEKHSVPVYPKNSQGDDSCWTWGKVKLATDANRCVARQTPDGSWRVFRKDYLVTEDGSTATTLPKSLWIDKEFNNDVGKKAVQELFDGANVFDFPKSVQLLRRLVDIGIGDEGLVLDFFAGACTTAQAVLEASRSRPGQRQFIMVQMPEATPDGSVARQKGFQDLSALAAERIRRAIKKLMREGKAKPHEDLGFRVFKLSPSHFKAWQGYTGHDPEQLQMLFDEAHNPLVNRWSSQGLLAEVLLLEGFPLDSSVVDMPGVKGNTVKVVASDHCVHRLLVCFDKQLKDEVVEGLVFEEQDVFICLDAALSDQAAQRLADRCTLKTI